MAFWLWLIGAVLSILGVLITAETHAADFPLWLLMGAGTFLPMGVAVLSVGLWLWGRKFLVGLPKMVVGAVLYTLSFLAIGVHTYGIYHRFDIQKITAPITVRATAELLELSDNLYDPATAEPYRQVVKLHNLRPVQSAGGTTPNPFYRAERDARLVPTATTLPDTLTVFATARPPKTSKTPDPLAVLSELKVGSRAELTLQLQPIVVDKRSDFNVARWLATRHVHATGQIVSVDSPIGQAEVAGLDKILLKIQGLRQQYRDVFYAKFASQDTARQSATAITLSLLTGDRALIDKNTTELYQYAGISHLLAISGTHVLFLAVLLANLATMTANRYFATVYARLPRWQLRFWVMVVASLLYALFTGFEVPAVRTVVMLFAVGVARYLLLSWSGFRVLAVVGFAMAIFDPFVLWQAGFWLSFVAVAVLMSYESTYAKPLTLKENLFTLARLQSYIFVAMLPISLLLFGKISLFGVVTNLVAVGLFGWVVVPLDLLAGVVYLVIPPLADGLWWLVAQIIFVLNQILKAFELLLGDVWLVRPMSLALLLLFMLGLMLARGEFFAKRLSLVLFITFLVGLSGLKSPSVNQITPLSTQTPELSAVLANDWLILSIYSNKPINDEKLATELQRALAKANQPTLAGVIVQNGDTAGRQTLGRVVGRLSLNLPIRELYWAGEPTRFGNLYTRTCQADVTIETEWGQLAMVTGWQSIKNERMHSCNVLITTNTLANAQNNNNNSETHTILIEHSTDKNLWGVYRLLCQTPINPNIIISHQKSTITSVHNFYFNQAKLVFTDGENKGN